MAGAGVLVLVRTSNPGAADIEDLELEGGGTVWERVAEIVDALGSAGVGEAGLSDVGAVVGATEPSHLARARELMGNATFLLPGVGAQGGRVEDLAPAFAPGRAGGLVDARRAASPTLIRRRRGARGRGTSRGRAPARGRLGAVGWSSGPSGGVENGWRAGKNRWR